MRGKVVGVELETLPPEILRPIRLQQLESNHGGGVQGIDRGGIDCHQRSRFCFDFRMQLVDGHLGGHRRKRDGGIWNRHAWRREGVGQRFMRGTSNGSDDGDQSDDNT